MNGQKRRKFKLAFPLKFQSNGKELTISDNFANDTVIDLDGLDTFEIKSLDSDGFALFEVTYSKSPEPKKPTLDVSQRVEASVNGYTLFYQSIPKSVSYGNVKSIYEYYKRERDLSYYALIKRESSKTRKLLLGSLLDSKSKIHQIALIIYQHFAQDKAFDRKDLTRYLPSSLSHRRLMKCALDTFTAEGFLTRTEERSIRGRFHEVFRRTKRLDKFIGYMVNPRSFQKPNGASVGQLALTSD